MSRPRTRTAVLASDRLALLHEVFGSSLHGWKQLGLGPGVTYAVFRRVWDGKEGVPSTVEAIEGAWRVWTLGLIERVKVA